MGCMSVPIFRSPAVFRAVLNGWPPYWGTGISVAAVAPDWRRCEVHMKQRFYSANAFGTHFGGSLYAVGGLKGTMLALAVELLCCAITGAALSHEAESLHLADGAPLRLGQAFMVLDPSLLAGRDVYAARVEALVDAMLSEDGVRLPGERRQRCMEEARRSGIEIGDELLRELRELARPA